MVSVKQSSKYHWKICARYKILKWSKASGKEKIMSRHAGCEFTFQYVGIPVRRDSWTFLRGPEALPLSQEPSAGTCTTLAACGVLWDCLVRPWQGCGSSVCGHAASSHFCCSVLKKVAMEPGMVVAIGQAQGEGILSWKKHKHSHTQALAHTNSPNKHNLVCT